MENVAAAGGGKGGCCDVVSNLCVSTDRGSVPAPAPRFLVWTAALLGTDPVEGGTAGSGEWQISALGFYLYNKIVGWLLTAAGVNQRAGAAWPLCAGIPRCQLCYSCSGKGFVFFPYGRETSRRVLLFWLFVCCGGYMCGEGWNWCKSCLTATIITVITRIQNTITKTWSATLKSLGSCPGSVLGNSPRLEGMWGSPKL